MIATGAPPTGEPAWRALRGELHRFVGSRVAAAEIDDVVQDALIRIHRGLAGVRDHDRMTAWIYQVARNAIIDHARRRRPVVTIEADAAALADPAADAPTVAADDDAAFARLAHCVRPFVGLLPAAYREAVALVELDGLGQAEAAARLGVPLSTLKSRVQRGRVQLRGLLEACCAIELDARHHVVELTPRCPQAGCGAGARPRVAERSS